MTLEEADKIVQIWGKYLEYVTRVNMAIFMSSIPESLLPFPKDVIEEACNIIAEYHHKNRNKAAVDTIQSTMGILAGYVDDEEAISRALEMWADPNARATLLANLKRSQSNWLKSQGYS